MDRRALGEPCLPPRPQAARGRARRVPARREDGALRPHRTQTGPALRARDRAGAGLRATVGLRPRLPAAPPGERARLERRARLLAWGGNAWHVVELAVALAAGLAAGSVALVGFGIDSLIEVASGVAIVWLFSGGRGASPTAERYAQQSIAASYALLAAYLAVEAGRDLADSRHPAASWAGIGLAVFTVPTMLLLARAKRRVGRRLISSAAVSEAGQNALCAYLSIALLVGLLANALARWWWADPVAALAIALVAARESRESWRGQSCECC